MTDSVAGASNGRLSSSASESARFGRRVARAALSETDDWTVVHDVLDEFLAGEHELAIVRYPAAWVGAFEVFARCDDVVSIFADALLYFEWPTSGPVAVTSHQPVGREGIEPTRLSAGISAIFDHYVNHYAANSDLDASLVGVGYAEWAQRLAEDARNPLVALESGGELAAVAVIDGTGAAWDIVLAGVAPAHRGAGLYGELVTSVMAAAKTAGVPAVRISTQSHNVQVIRTWERLGWRLVGSWITVHLSRG